MRPIVGDRDADFLRLIDHGYVRTGMTADLTVLDPARIEDRATYDDLTSTRTVRCTCS